MIECSVPDFKGFECFFVNWPSLEFLPALRASRVKKGGVFFLFWIRQRSKDLASHLWRYDFEQHTKPV